MTYHTAQARELAEQIVDFDMLDEDGCVLRHQLKTRIIAALLAVEQRVWEEAAAYLDAEAKRFDHIDDGEAHMIRAFAVWCRAKARQALGRENEHSHE